jgi:alkaline phosphatase
MHQLGIQGQKVLKSEDFLSQVFLVDEHIAEEVPVLAVGPGSDRVQGFVPNTRVFDWTMQAFGWHE